MSRAPSTSYVDAMPVCDMLKRPSAISTLTHLSVASTVLLGVPTFALYHGGRALCCIGGVAVLPKGSSRHHRRTQPRFTKSTVARILGVHRLTVARWLKQGDLGGLDPESLCDFLRRNGWRGRLANVPQEPGEVKP